jgi:hypothetical protein
LGGVELDTSSEASGEFDLNDLGPGVYVIGVSATDSDADHPGDSLSSSDSRVVEIVDDDDTGPTITLGGSQGAENVSDAQLFTWTVTDASGLDSTTVEVHKDGNLIHSTTLASGSFDFNSEGIGEFTIEVVATDGDNDRPADAATASGSRSVTVVDDTVDTTIRIIDDGDPLPGYRESVPGFLVNSSGTGAFGDHRTSNPDFGNRATWTFNDLDNGLYVVSATWTAHFNRAGNAQYTLTATDGPGTVSEDVYALQRAAPDDFSANGIASENLAVIEVNGIGGTGSITVELTDSNANGLVEADAIRVAPAPAIVVSEGSLNIPDGAGIVPFGPTGLGDLVVRTFTVENTGQSDLILDDMSVAGPHFSLASPLAAGVVPPGSSTTFDVRFAAVQEGSFTGTVSFTTNDPTVDVFDFT